MGLAKTGGRDSRSLLGRRRGEDCWLSLSLRGERWEAMAPVLFTECNVSAFLNSFSPFLENPSIRRYTRALQVKLTVKYEFKPGFRQMRNQTIERCFFEHHVFVLQWRCCRLRNTTSTPNPSKMFAWDISRISQGKQSGAARVQALGPRCLGETKAICYRPG